MTFQRRTLASDVVFEGLGLHTGVPVRVIVHPAQDGLHFRSESGRWKASPENVSDTSRCTRLGDISTIEHLMSAFAGLEVTDAEVEVSGGELPGLGGNAQGYVEALVACGFANLGEAASALPFKRVFFEEGEVKVAIGKGDGHWRYTYDVGDRWPGSQSFESEDVIGEYATAIAPARTFALIEELPMIEKYGLGKGLDWSSALVLDTKEYKNPARFPNEPARHKLLDLIGDLYLSGIPIRFLNVTADRSGHRTNVAAAKLLLEHTTC